MKKKDAKGDKVFSRDEINENDLDTIFVEGKYPNGDDFFENQETTDIDYVIEDWEEDNRNLASYKIYLRFNNGDEKELMVDAKVDYDDVKEEVLDKYGYTIQDFNKGKMSRKEARQIMKETNEMYAKRTKAQKKDLGMMSYDEDDMIEIFPLDKNGDNIKLF